MSYNFEEIFKKLYSLFQEAKPGPHSRHPPHLFASCDGGFSTWWTAMCRLQARFLLAKFTREMRGGRAWWSAKRCHLITDHWIGLKFNMKIDNSVLLLCYLDKIRLLLLATFGELWRVYIVMRASKREPEPAASPQSATPHSTGNISVKEGSRPQQHKWNSKALFFPTQNYCCT